MFAAIYWAFGWRVFSVAAIYFGCQAAAEYMWTGGAFLRQDWLFWLVVSACFVRKRHFALAGAAFAYATLLRVFPGVLVIGWAVVMIAHFWKHKRIAPHHARLVLGGVSATVLLVSISIAVAGASAYPEFYEHIQVHKHTPLTNNMGLETVLSQSYAGRMAFTWNPKAVDPCQRWEEMRRDRMRAFRPLHVVLVLGLLVGFVAVVRRVKSLWTAQALALSVVIAVVELTCYYYSMFLLAALLSRHRRGIEQWVLAVAGISQLIAVNRFFASHYDDLFLPVGALCFFPYAFGAGRRAEPRDGGTALRRASRSRGMRVGTGPVRRDHKGAAVGRLPSGHAASASAPAGRSLGRLSCFCDVTARDRADSSAWSERAAISITRGCRHPRVWRAFSGWFAERRRRPSSACSCASGRRKCCSASST
jgi:hypothetical protein